MVQVAYALSNFPLELLPQGEFHLGGCGLPGSQGLTDEQCDDLVARVRRALG